MRVGPRAVVVAALALVGGALTWVSAPPAYAIDSTMVVTTTADTTIPDNACSLREAVENAATDYPLNQDCTYGGGNSTIVFDLPDDATILLLGTLTIQDLGATVIDGDDNVTIEGRGDNLTMLAVAPSAAVTLTGLTLERPATVGALRGVQSSGNLVVRDSIFQNFITPIGADGAGILAEGGTLTVTGSTFSHNDAGSGGGAISTSVGGVITNNTFYANDASRAAGVLAGGTTTVSFNTFVNNTASGDAALYGFGITYSANVFQGNRGVFSGVCNDGSVDGGFNVTDHGSCREVDSSLLTSSPGLAAGAPADNGGPTGTIALVDGSSAIDYIPADDTACPALDQRGFVRPAGASCDAGAYEFGAQLPDVTDPVVTVPEDITTPATGPTGALVTFNATASDDRDGELTPTCTPESGSTFVLGTTTVTCTATDAAGNTGSAEFDITVTPQPTVYDFSGLLAPIDALPAVNKAKAGSSVPVKFSLGGDFGLDVLAEGFPGSQDVPCGSGATDTLEQTLSTNRSGLSYDATTGVYTYVWSTKKSWSGTCRNLRIDLVDGTSQTVAFAFK